MVSLALEMSLTGPSGAPGAGPLPCPTEPVEMVLPVTGGQPLRLSGVVLAETNSWTSNASSWHEVTLIRLAGGEMAVTLRTLHRSAEEHEVHRAARFPSIDAATAWLEGFDPTWDIQPDFNADDRRLSTAVLALRAAGLRVRTDALARQWRAMLGDLLYRLAVQP